MIDANLATSFDCHQPSSSTSSSSSSSMSLLLPPCLPPLSCLIHQDSGQAGLTQYGVHLKSMKETQPGDCGEEIRPSRGATYFRTAPHSCPPPPYTHTHTQTGGECITDTRTTNLLTHTPKTCGVSHCVFCFLFFFNEGIKHRITSGKQT